MYLKVKPVPAGRRVPEGLGKTVGLWLGGLSFVGLVAFLLWQGLMPNFVRLEREQLIHQAEVVHQGLNQAKLDLLNLTTDWALWDDSYAFLARPDPGFIQTNITPSSMYANSIEYMAFFRPDGRLVYAGRFTPTETVRPSSLAVAELRRPVETRLATGFIRVDGSLLMVASVQVLPSGGEGLSRGYLVFARRFELGKFSLPDPANTNVRLTLIPAPAPAPVGRGRSSRISLGLVEPLDERTQQIGIFIPDLSGRVIARLELVQNRSLSRLGQQIVNSSILASAAVALLFVLLGRTLVRRLETQQYERLALERRYRALVQQAAEGIALLDSRSFAVLEANHSLGELLDYSPEALVGRSMLDLVAYEASWTVRRLEAVLAGQPMSGEYQLRRRDGSLLHVEGSVSAVVEGQDSFLLLVMHSVQARKEAETALQSSQEALQKITDAMLDCVVQASLEGQIRFVTPSIHNLLGYPVERMLGANILDFVEPRVREEVRAYLEQAAHFGVEPAPLILQVRHADGRTVYLEALGGPIHKEGEAAVFQFGFRDVSARVAAERAVRQHKTLLQQVTDGMLDVVMLCDLEARIEYVTPSSEHLFGYKPEEMMGMNALDLIHPEHQERALETLARGLADPTNPANTRIEVLDVRKDGTPVWVEVVGNVIYQGGQPHKLLFGSRDITQRKSYESQIAHQALHDALTGLGNRRMLEDRAAHTIAIAQRKGWSVSLILLDVDRFKNINDTLGHFAGDELLVQISRLLGECIRLEDTLVRYSGDEFAILLTDANPASARKVAERILASLSKPLELRGHKLQVSVSIGIASSPQDGSEITDLLKAADIAMYQAKRSGAGIVVYDPSQNPYSEEHLHLEASLRQAVSAQVFEFHYQPIFDLRSQRIVSVESLVRWNQQGQWVSPARFIPLAEELRLIERIDTLGLRRALEWLKSHSQLPLEVSLNLSAQTLRDPTLPQHVGRLLEEFDLSAQQLIFEITETALLSDLKSAQQVLGELRALGAKIALDDFGSGYASVAYLRHLPIDRLKLDRTLVINIGGGEAGEQLLRAMIQLGHTLGMEVLAEGVETLEQMDWLRQHGCDLIQGYYIAKPQPVPALMELLANRAREAARA